MARGRPKKKVVEEEEEYVVEEIKMHRLVKRGALEYRVKWQGYDQLGDDTWEPASGLKGCPERVEMYWKSLPLEEQLDRHKKGTREYEKLQAKIEEEQQQEAEDADGSDEDRSAEEGSDDEEEEQTTTSNRNEPKRSDNNSQSKKKKRSSSTGHADTAEDTRPFKRAKNAQQKEATPEAGEEGEGEHGDEAQAQDGDEEESEDEAEEFEPGSRVEENWVDVVDTRAPGSWEDLIDKIDTCIAGTPDMEGRPLMLCVWKKTTKRGLPIASWVDSKICREACPQRTLDFYEIHLKFKPTGQETVASEGDQSVSEDDDLSEPEDAEDRSTSKTSVSPTKSRSK